MLNELKFCAAGAAGGLPRVVRPCPSSPPSPCGCQRSQRRPGATHLERWHTCLLVWYCVCRWRRAAHAHTADAERIAGGGGGGERRGRLRAEAPRAQRHALESGAGDLIGGDGGWRRAHLEWSPPNRPPLALANVVIVVDEEGVVRAAWAAISRMAIFSTDCLQSIICTAPPPNAAHEPSARAAHPRRPHPARLPLARVHSHVPAPLSRAR